MLITIALLGCTSNQPADSNSVANDVVEVVGNEDTSPTAIDVDIRVGTPPELPESGDSKVDSGEPNTEPDPGPDLSWVLADLVPCDNQLAEFDMPTNPNYACNAYGLNQDGENFQIYDHLGDVIVLELSTMWCSVCRTIADKIKLYEDQYSDLTWITVLTEDSTGDTVETNDLSFWSGVYQIDEPVVSLEDGFIGSNADQWRFNGIPTFYFIDRKMGVRDRQAGWNEQITVNRIESLISESR